MTLTLDGAVHPIDQVTKQLHKLVNVIKIRDMEPDATVAREMAIFRVTAPVESRAEIMQFAEIFRAKIVDVSRRTMTIEVTGPADKIEAFERMSARTASSRWPAPAKSRSPARATEPSPAPSPTLRSYARGLRLPDARRRWRLVSVTGRGRARPTPSAAVFAARGPTIAGSAGRSPGAGFAIAGARRRPRGHLARRGARFARGRRARPCFTAAPGSSTSRRACRTAPGRSGSAASRSSRRRRLASHWASLPPALDESCPSSRSAAAATAAG